MAKRKRKPAKMRPMKKPGKMPLPVQNEREMVGWPGTLPPKRMRIMIQAMETGRDPQGEQILLDMEMLIKANDCLGFSAKIPDGMYDPIPAALDSKTESFIHLERMTVAAQEQDTAFTIGGIMSRSNPDEHSEQRLLFKLLRDPEWIGFNKVLPMLKGLNATISESREMPGRPGLVSAEPTQDRFPPGTEKEFPDGEAELLAQVLRWHGLREVRWRPQSAEVTRSSWYNR